MRSPQSVFWAALLSSGAGCVGGYTAPDSADCAALSSERIGEVMDGQSNIEIPCATVTFVRQDNGEDAAGFFLQAEAAGPAMYVQMGSDELEEQFGFAPVEGQRVGLQVKGTVESVEDIRRTVMALHGLEDLGEGTPLSELVTDFTDDPLMYEEREANDFRLGLLTGELLAWSASSGDGFRGFPIFNLPELVLDGVMPVIARFPDDYLDKYGLAQKCALTMGPTPLWPRPALGTFEEPMYNGKLHFTAWRDEQIDFLGCEEAYLSEVERAEDGWLELRLRAPNRGFGEDPYRWWNPNLEEFETFTVNDMVPTAIENSGEVLRLEVPGLADEGPYSVQGGVAAKTS